MGAIVFPSQLVSTRCNLWRHVPAHVEAWEQQAAVHGGQTLHVVRRGDFGVVQLVPVVAASIAQSGAHLRARSFAAQRCTVLLVFSMCDVLSSVT